MVTRTTTASARQQAIRKQVEAATPEHAPAWKKDDHPTLAGVLARYTDFRGTDKAGPCKVAVIADETVGETSVYIRNDHLVQQFSEKRPRPGEWVCLKFLGRREGARMNFYALEVDRDAADDRPTVPESFDVPKLTVDDDDLGVPF